MLKNEIDCTVRLQKASKKSKKLIYLRNQHRLIAAVSQHARVCVISHIVQMARHLVLLLATVEVNHLHGVHRQALVRVDHHAKQTRVGLLFEIESKIC
jgi:hypothetical protein